MISCAVDRHGRAAAVVEGSTAASWLVLCSAGDPHRISGEGRQRQPVEHCYSGLLGGDPGPHLIVVVGNVVLGYVVGSGVPDAVMTQDIPQCLIQIFRRVWTSDIVWMQRETHHS